MKKYIFLILVFFIANSCNKLQEKAMKSADKNFILKVANEKFEQKKWKDALALYDRVANLVAGTDELKDIAFKTAYANYYDKNYPLAGHQFKNFSVRYPEDPRREEAAYLSALCYYQDSRDYNLDQTSTISAINELQSFLNTFPNSDRAKNVGPLIDELSYKLEFKAYENARQYFKMADYKAAVVSFENVLNDFPATKLKPKIIDFIMRSKYQLALNSIFDLKEDRILNAIAYTKTVEQELPNTDFAKQAVKYRQDLEAEKVKFAKVKAEVDKRKAEVAAKQKIAVEKLNAEELQKTQAKEQIKAEKKATQMKIDSAKMKNPTPAATFKIKR